MAMLTLCYFIMSRATLILFGYTSMLRLHDSLTSHAVWLPHKSDIVEFRVYLMGMQYFTTQSSSCSIISEQPIELLLVKLNSRIKYYCSA